MCSARLPRYRQDGVTQVESRLGAKSLCDVKFWTVEPKFGRCWLYENRAASREWISVGYVRRSDDCHDQFREFRKA